MQTKSVKTRKIERFTKWLSWIFDILQFLRLEPQNFYLKKTIKLKMLVLSQKPEYVL